ncbi:MAG: alpha-2-macroglobulin [Hyphomicrobiales bacterium]
MISKKNYLKPILTSMMMILPIMILSVSGQSDDQWKKVEKLISKGETASASKETEQILHEAVEKNDVPQVLRAVQKLYCLEQDYREDYAKRNISRLDSLILKTKKPLKGLLEITLANNYSDYYSKNSYRINKRIPIADNKSKDIDTWDKSKFFEEVYSLYQEYLTKDLFSFPISDFSDIIEIPKEDLKLRPTLFDVYANQAINNLQVFSRNNENLYSSAFNIRNYKEKSLLQEPEKFIDTKLSSYSTIQDYILKLYADISRYHLKNDNIAALSDITISRIDFVSSYYSNKDKDELVKGTYNKLLKKSEGNDIYSYIASKFANYYVDKGNLYDNKKEDHKWDIKKALEIATKGKEMYPKSYGGKECADIIKRITKKEIDFNLQKVVLPNKEFLSLISYKNLDKVYIRVYQTDNDFNQERRFNDDALIQELNKYPVVQQYNFELPEVGDYRLHKVEVDNPQVTALGRYVMLVSYDPEFKDPTKASYSMFSVSGLSYVANKLNNSIELYVLDRESGNYLSNIDVYPYNSEYDNKQQKYVKTKLGQLKTDKEGKATYTLKDKKSLNHLYFSIVSKKDTVSTEYFYLNNYSYSEKLKKEIKLFTDRAIYRPGQTVYFKGILFAEADNEYKLLKNENVSIRFLDVNRKELSKVNKVTSDNGSLDGSFVIPDDVLTGRFKIVTSYGQMYIDVEEYKRPTFQVTFDPLNGNYKLNQAIEVKGNVKAFAGYSIPDANITYTVKRKSLLFFRDNPFIDPYPYALNEGTIIKSGKALSDNNGDFSIEFDASPDPTDIYNKNDYSYEINVTASSPTGESQSNFTYVAVGQKSLVLNTDLAELINKNSFKGFKVLSKNLNDEKVDASGEIKIYKLQQAERILRSRILGTPDTYIIPIDEYLKKFPEDIYADEDNPLIWDRKEVYKNNFNTGSDENVSIATLDKWEQGYYLIELKSKDAFNQEVKYQKVFTIYDDKSKKMPVISPDWFNVSSLRALPGETIDISVGSSYKDNKTLIKIYNGETLLFSKWYKTGNKKENIPFEIKENYRGGISVVAFHVNRNRIYTHQKTIDVPFDNKKLDVSLASYRDKLKPGQAEEWTINIKDYKGNPILSNMFATMYDASLDQFKSNSWAMQLFFATRYSNLWQNDNFSLTSGRQIMHHNDFGYGMSTSIYPELSTSCYDMYSDNVRMRGNVAFSARAKNVSITEGEFEEVAMDVAVTKQSAEIPEPPQEGESKKETQESAFQIRRDFNETAFFYPNLMTNKDGDIIIKFTTPESLTQWKLLGLAYTNDLKVGEIEKTFTSSKDLMITANAPRFLREGDEISFPANVVNMSDKDLSIDASLEIIDPFTNKEISGINKDNKVQNVNIKAGQSQAINWKLQIPDGVSAITYRLIAKSSTFSDGEEMLIPVLSNRTMVTSTEIIELNNNETKDYQFSDLLNMKKSASLDPYRLTFEFTNNPVWYAIQALPTLSESNVESADNLISKYFASSMSAYIVNSNPKIKQVFDLWKKLQPEAFLSNLEKNQELKSIVLEQTPWLIDAQNEKEQKQKIAAYFNMEKIGHENDIIISKLKKLQLPDGSFPWFSGMKGSRYTTQNIIFNLARLHDRGIINIKSDSDLNYMVSRAVKWMDAEMTKDYKKMKSDEERKKYYNPYPITIQYLLARSYVIKIYPVKKNDKAAFDYLVDKATHEWLKQNNNTRAMIGLLAHQLDIKHTANAIAVSFKDRAIYKKNLGMYWKSGSIYYTWDYAPISTQALLIELFDKELKDQTAISRMKQWLLKNKQTRRWSTSRATLDAVYALVFTGSNLIDQTPEFKATIGKHTVSSNIHTDQAGTAYVKKAWVKKEISPDMGNIKIERKGEGPAFGAVYFQYFEDLDKVKASASPLNLEKKLYIKRTTKDGVNLIPISKGGSAQVGDEIVIRIILTADRDMDFIQLSDLRASGLEPTQTFSGYKYQDGLGYYQSIKDESTDFFFDHVRKGTYVFTYSVYAAQAGNFSNGIAKVQSYYAPEFNAHSQGIRLVIE